MSKPCICTLCQKPCWGERCATCRDAIGPTEVTTYEAVDILGVTYRQADYWVRTVLNRDTGIGRNRRLSLADLIVLKQLAVMLEAGMTLPHARKHLGDSVIRVEHCTIRIDQEGIAMAMLACVQRLRGAAA